MRIWDWLIKLAERQSWIRFPIFSMKMPQSLRTKDLAKVRKGAIWRICQKNCWKKTWEPDYGERKIHPTAGYSCRCPYATRCFQHQPWYRRPRDCQKISKIIRGSSGGYKYCKSDRCHARRWQHRPSLYQHGQLGTIPIVSCRWNRSFRSAIVMVFASSEQNSSTSSC